ncbi:universal stress protein/MSMEI_3859 [bacterium BMS3Abin07]|nr:universal stress protein/MSMEI_3859 [bacterium BMS3Abin07]GBE32635.1 universal stress protein/MSMEI_3859 [bacterium BMS3Bbin05]HDL20515.1 universal stress protein [Nitrospirota bacterium]HDO23222.1 universal stress protein [Nitrospirota bacterium]HDZ88119.1 universal stress protein [Nitrospirota bacterium]
MAAGEVCPIAKLETILLASDGSEFSEGAVREAIRFAKNCSSRLYVVSVVETNPALEAYGPDVVEKMEKKTREIVEEIRGRAQDEGISCEILSRRGEDTYKYIVEEAGKLNADIIVMGRRGRRGIKRLMMGSVTALVVGNAPCDVFVVPRTAELSCEKILIATDGSEHSKKAVTEAISIAKRCGSTVMAISVVSKEDELPEAEVNLKTVKEIGRKEGIEVEPIAVTGTPYEAIINTAQVKNADLIVVGTHGRTGLKKFLIGSVAERVIASAHCVVMVAR